MIQYYYCTRIFYQFILPLPYWGPLLIITISQTYVSNIYWQECGKSYSTDEKLKKHVKKHHDNGKSKRSRKDLEDDPSSDDDLLDAGQVDADKVIFK